MSDLMIVLIVFVAVLLSYYILPVYASKKCNNLNKKNIFFNMSYTPITSYLVPIRVQSRSYSRGSLVRNNRTLKSEYCRINSFPALGYDYGKSSI